MACEHAKILVAAGNSTQAEPLRQFLEQEGYLVTVANNGREALQRLRESAPDIVVCGTVMPETDGFELCRQIKSDPGARQIPVILLTSPREPVDIVRELQCGADNFVSKPWQGSHLLNCIRYLLADGPVVKEGKEGTGIEVELSGSKHLITADRAQILSLLLSTYNSLVKCNAELEKAQTELAHLNKRLEETVRQRVSGLLAEMRQQTGEIYRTLINSCAIGIYIVQDGWFRFANQKFQEITGYSSNEVLELKALSLVHPNDREEVRKKAIEMLKGKRSSAYEFRVMTKSGREIWATETVNSITYHGKRAALGNFMDITELKQMQEQLMAADRMASIGQLASGIAHEMNNPLTAVIGFTDMLLQKGLPKDIEEDLRIVSTQAQRSAEIAKNLLTFARSRPQEKQPLDVNDCIQKVLELRAYQQKVNKIRVDTLLEANLPLIMGNVSQLQQVFFNLVINAEFFMLEAHGKGVLTISSSRPGNSVRVWFADDGPGISPENIQKLFTPFFSTKEAGRGTGLGLSICQGIVAEHGGRIWAESKPGIGATFIVELPVFDG